MMGQGYGQIEERLARAIGLDTASVGTHLIKRAVETRMAASGVESLAGYAELLDGSGAELQALIEEVVVPESWFFRDSRPFEVLCQHARARRACDPSLPPLRVLSLPCAGGRNPTPSPWRSSRPAFRPRFHIDAVDISDRASRGPVAACTA